MDNSNTKQVPAMTPTQEVRYLRSKVASNSTKKGAMATGGVSLVSTYAALRLATKYAIPFDVAAAGVSLVTTGFGWLASYFARGGRKGESD